MTAAITQLRSAAAQHLAARLGALVKSVEEHPGAFTETSLRHFAGKHPPRAIVCSFGGRAAPEAGGHFDVAASLHVFALAEGKRNGEDQAAAIAEAAAVALHNWDPPLAPFGAPRVAQIQSEYTEALNLQSGRAIWSVECAVPMRLGDIYDPAAPELPQGVQPAGLEPQHTENPQ